MQNILRTLSSEIVFWSAWVLIPFIMEIIPAIFGFFILLRKSVVHKQDPELVYYPQITIIVPIYNSEGTLEECLKSIKESTYPNNRISILLVNNGSKDGSFQIFQKIQKENIDMDIRWLNAKQGKSKALNMALFNSQGKYIIHIDSDGLLHKDAITNVVKRFEAHEDVHCVTGSILTDPQFIKESKGFRKKLLQNIEFCEYAQAFLAGRNYEAEMDSIFTMSGAFSAFRKSTILKTQLYNTETLCEDTHVTFQVRHNLKKKIDICENAIFFVEPIDSLGRLYVQRQRWQRGEIEVVHMFPYTKSLVKGFFSNFVTRLLVYDHTFAFPRMIWYFALLFLTYLNYPISQIGGSLIIVYILYVASGLLNYLNICLYLKWDKELLKCYSKKIIYIFLLPMYNFIIYWFRFAGIINSIKGTSMWRTYSFQEEIGFCKKVIASDFSGVKKMKQKLKTLIYKEKV